MKKFNSLIHLENENVINFYVLAQVEFDIPYLNDALEFFETDTAGLQEMFNDKSFFEEFTSNYHVNITQLEYLSWDNHN